MPGTARSPTRAYAKHQKLLRTTPDIFNRLHKGSVFWSHFHAPCYGLGRGTTLILPTNPWVWSPPPNGAVAVVTASRGRGGGSPRLRCRGKGASGGCGPRCLENVRTYKRKMGLSPTSLLLFLLPDHKTKGTPSWWLWAQRVSGVPSRTLQGPLREPWRNRPRVRRIPPMSSGKMNRQTVTLPASLPTPGLSSALTGRGT